MNAASHSPAFNRMSKTSKKGKSSTSEPAPGPKSSPKSGSKGPSGGGKGNPNIKNDDVPAEPARQTIFPGWTGKTPSSLLHEHCQKNGWEKPIFDPKRTRQGFICTITLGKRNKKTGQIETCSFTLEDVAKPTAAEARHYGATYALHRVNSHKNMIMILPPGPRDLWSKLNDDKQKAGVQGTHLYVEDPFMSNSQKMQMQQEAQRKELEQMHKARELAAKRAGGASTESSDSSRPATPNAYTSKSILSPEALAEQKKKDWEKLPMVHMNQELRVEVEEVVKKQMAGELYQTYIDEYGSSGEPMYNMQLSKTLVRMGFRDRHVAEALQYCNDQASALDWLCLHVPEDDLPPSFLQSNYNPTITTIAHNSTSIKREYAVKRLSAIGFTSTVCGNIYDLMGADENRAMEELFRRLAFPKGKVPEDMIPDPEIQPESEELTKEFRDDEMLALESIYDDRFKKESDGGCKILLTTNHPGTNKNTGSTMELEIRIPETSTYPYQQPPLFIIHEPSMPSYLRLSIIQKTMQQAYRALATAMGGPIIYDVVEWIQENLRDILDNPPSLVQLTEGLITVDLSQEAENQDAIAEETEGESLIQSLQSKLVVKKGNAGSRPTGGKTYRKVNIKANSPASVEMLKAYNKMKETDVSFQAMLMCREKLPAWSFKEQLIKAVRDNRVVIVCGETGCGKTTQVPQFILDDWIQSTTGEYANIVCTQPRRIAAIGVAERVAVERNTSIGEQVGYSIRGENKSSRQTKLMFCTTGILLRRLHSDPMLQGVTHVMVDEVHERSVDSDFLLIILRDLLKKRHDLKLILMSATINSEFFSGYFDGCPVYEIPGFTHPVEELYMEHVIARTGHSPNFGAMGGRRIKFTQAMEEEWERTAVEYKDRGMDDMTIQKIKTMEAYAGAIDYDFIAASVADILKRKEPAGSVDGAILIFLPGVMEIKKCIEALTQLSRTVTQQLDIMPLHAALTPKEQSAVFAPVRKGVRKIVVATNVAETSITIDGIVYVIDSGRVKETQMSNNMTKLVETWTSFASTRQRKGRAGRTRPGIVYKMFSKKQSDKLAPQQDPEILRIPLEQLCLSVKAMGEKDVEQFLSKALTPPSTKAIQVALNTLENLGALDSTTGELTPLGRHMADIPADLRVAKMLIFGSIFRCLEPILVVASCMSVKSPFVSPMDKRDEAQQKKLQFATAKSDLLTAWKAYSTWEQLKDSGETRGGLKQFCEESFLSTNTLYEIQNLKSQYLEVLEDIGFTTASSRNKGRRRSERCSAEEDNVNSDNMTLVKAVILSGLYPNVIKVKMPDAKFDKMIGGTVERETVVKEIRMFTQDDGRVFLHPSSILFHNNQFPVPFLVYFSKLETSKVFIHDATMLSMYGLLLFGGQVNVDHLGRGLEIGKNGFIRLRAFARIGVLVNQLKKLLDALLQAKIANPDLNVSDSPVVDMMLKLIDTDGV